MQITPIETPIIGASSCTLFELLDKHITNLPNGSILAITSKVVSLCEGSTVTLSAKTKEELVLEESEYYLPAKYSAFGHHFTITNNTLIPMSGIDESNGDGQYVLWPKDPQRTANRVRAYLIKRFIVKDVGVVITDSTSHILRRGTTGIALAHSGFSALRDYAGTNDLFGRPYAITMANIAEGLAGAAVLAMGEGNERTPLCLIHDLPAIEFKDEDPTQAELDFLHFPMEEDLFAPFLTNVAWEPGQNHKR